MIITLKDSQSIEVLKSCLNKTVQDIYVTGWMEKGPEFNYFSTMDWWYYVQFNDTLLLLFSSTTSGMLKANFQNKIEKNFEVEDYDEFTVMRISSINQCPYEDWKVIGIDLFFSKYCPSEISAIGFECKDFHQKERYVFFDSMTLDGIEVGGKKEKEYFLEDERHYFEKLI